MPGMRRVVTGIDSAGRAIVASDMIVERNTIALMPGAAFASLWGSDGSLRVPNTGDRPAYRDWFPPAGGFRVEEIILPPDGEAPPGDVDMKAALAEMEAKLPGLAGHMDPDHPGMHQTATVDVNYIVSGRCVVELGDGTHITLAAGDCLVQNGTRHAWRVPYAEPCRLVCFSIGAALGEGEPGR